MTNQNQKGKVDGNNLEAKHEVGDVWKDKTAYFGLIWKVQFPKGVSGFKTKREATKFAEQLKYSKQEKPTRDAFKAMIQESADRINHKELPNIHAEINQAQAESQRKEGFKKTVYFVQRTVTNENGEFIPCIAVEGERGYHTTDWAWGKDYKVAEECANKKNEALGISRKEAMLIVIGTMRR